MPLRTWTLRVREPASAPKQLQALREDLGTLKGLAEAFAGDKGGSTGVDDWDWRMREEVDGTIKELPLLEMWLNRARGPVVTEKPARVK